MAKRRNLKKEKAQRNLAYARKFRKNKNTGSFFKNRRFSDRNESQNQNGEKEEKSSEEKST
ncbi:MAG: hypothetical protein SXA11_07200 [Cyanobacteriota bacterium]|nr:hypothetical protein [Cyanobacteriota bacterium]